MPKTADFRRAIDIQSEMNALIDRMDHDVGPAALARLNIRLDILTRELALLQAPMPEAA